MKTKNAHQPKEAVPQIDTSFLLSKVDQSASVRSTFTLTPESSAILDKLSDKANITQREVFDVVVSLNLMNDLAEGIKRNPPTAPRSVRRTLVLSSKALEQLEKIAKETEIKRDDLACGAISMYLAAHNLSIELHQKRWKRLQEIVYAAVSDSINWDGPKAAVKSAEDVSEADRELAVRIATNCLYVAADFAGEPRNWSNEDEFKQLRTIAEGLEPIEITDSDRKSPDGKVAYLQKLEAL